MKKLPILLVVLLGALTFVANVANGSTMAYPSAAVTNDTGGIVPAEIVGGAVPCMFGQKITTVQASASIYQQISTGTEMSAAASSFAPSSNQIKKSTEPAIPPACGCKGSPPPFIFLADTHADGTGIAYAPAATLGSGGNHYHIGKIAARIAMVNSSPKNTGADGSGGNHFHVGKMVAPSHGAEIAIAIT